jgi:leader peptidase (prepilin peptidase) / N-methyltransferase
LAAAVDRLWNSPLREFGPGRPVATASYASVFSTSGNAFRIARYPDLSMISAFYALVGLALGSFANVCIHRIPKGESLARPRSRCPRCGTMVPWYQNIPLISFALLRGRCAFCRQPISWRYPVVEALTAALVAVAGVRYPDDPLLAALGIILALYLVVIAFIDWDHQIIPDVLSLSLAGVGLAASAGNVLLGQDPWARVLNALAGSLTGFSVMLAVALLGQWVWKKEAMGGGDIKFMAAVGALLGWKGVAVTLFFGSLTGTLYAAVLIAGKKMGRGAYLPFGPFLALGAWIAWTWYPVWAKFYPG